MTTGAAVAVVEDRRHHIAAEELAEIDLPSLQRFRVGQAIQGIAI